MVRLRGNARTRTSMDTSTGLTLGEAARACGVDRSTLRRAIRRGALSATKDAQGVWRVEPGELHRVYAPAERPAEAVDGVPDAALGQSTADALERAHDALVAELRATIADLRRDRDEWREQAQRLALPTPKGGEGRGGWWRWLRTSG